MPKIADLRGYSALVALLSFVGSLGLGGCSEDGYAIGGGRDAALNYDGAPPGCSYEAARLCWVCAAASDGGPARYAVGCRSAGDCLLFCGPIAQGFVACSYLGSASPPLCRDWIPPKPRLSQCEQTFDSVYGAIYSCPGCPFEQGALLRAADTDGNCALFDSDCLPEGYQESAACL